MKDDDELWTDDGIAANKPSGGSKHLLRIVSRGSHHSYTVDSVAG